MPVSADISAIYEAQSDDEFEQALDFAMTIEVNDAGDARLHITGRTGYFLIRDGEAVGPWTRDNNCRSEGGGIGFGSDPPYCS